MWGVPDVTVTVSDLNLTQSQTVLPLCALHGCVCELIASFTRTFIIIYAALYLWSMNKAIICEGCVFSKKQSVMETLQSQEAGMTVGLY